MRKLDTDLDEIDQHISTWRPDSPIRKNKLLRAKVKSAYKPFHAMLVWGLATDKSLADESSTRLYFTEVLSDLSHGFFLALIGIYKPSKSSLRSSIENMVRVYLLIAQVDPAPLKSVYDMFAKARQAYHEDAIAVGLINKLYAEYSELCKTVHSAGINYLSLTIPFEQLGIFNEEEFLSSTDFVKNISKLLNQATFWIFESSLPLAGHANEDMVRDALPRHLKRARSLPSVSS